MRNIKKGFSLVLVCLFAALMLTGCHGSVDQQAFVIPEQFDTSRPFELTFWAKSDTNKVQTGINYANICAGFGALKRVAKPVIYGTREAVFNKLVGMVDSNKRPIFQQPITAAAAGVLLGATIKYEDAMGAGELLIGDAKKYLQNVVAPIIIEKDKDLDNHKVVFSGYTCQQGVLTDDKAFALVSED
jgi:HK97 family phage major capsid protein